MNPKVTNLLYFVSGVAAGAVSTYVLVRRYFEEKADEEVESVKLAFEDKLSEIECDDNKSSVTGDLEGPSEIDDKDTKEKVRELNNKPDITDYTKFFTAKGEKLDGVSETLRDAKEEALAEAEHPQDDEPLTETEDEDEQLDFEDYKLHGESRDAIESDRAPYEIDKSDYDLTCANYEKMTLSYYQFDEVLADDTEEVLDSRRLIGSVLEDSGFTDDDRDVLYVRNDKIMADFEITKMYSSFVK